MSRVLITGANRGLGLEFARQYAAEGWDVIATARNPKRSKELEQAAKNKSKRQPQTVLTAWLVEILPRVVGYHL